MSIFFVLLIHVISTASIQFCRGWNGDWDFISLLVWLSIWWLSIRISSIWSFSLSPSILCRFINFMHPQLLYLMKHYLKLFIDLLEKMRWWLDLFPYWFDHRYDGVYFVSALSDHSLHFPLKNCVCLLTFCLLSWCWPFVLHFAVFWVFSLFFLDSGQFFWINGLFRCKKSEENITMDHGWKEFTKDAKSSKYSV